MAAWMITIWAKPGDPTTDATLPEPAPDRQQIQRPATVTIARCPSEDTGPCPPYRSITTRPGVFCHRHRANSRPTAACLSCSIGGLFSALHSSLPGEEAGKSPKLPKSTASQDVHARRPSPLTCITRRAFPDQRSPASLTLAGWQRMILADSWFIGHVAGLPTVPPQRYELS